MADITTTPQTRVLIGGATLRGHAAREAVEVFAAVTVAALDAFDTDAARYGLDDDAYHRFEKDSGVYALLELATGIEDRLNELAEQRR